MQIQVLYFAVFRERIGRDGEPLELADGATVAAAIDALAARHPVIAQLRGRFRIAVEQDFVDDRHVLHAGDELALIPPVAGGSDRHVLLSADALSLDRCVAAVSGPGMGGLVTFTGLVRGQSRGVAIDHLEYEAYPPRPRSRPPARDRRAGGRDRRRGAPSGRGVHRVSRDDRSPEGSRADLEEGVRRRRRILDRSRAVIVIVIVDVIDTVIVAVHVQRERYRRGDRYP